MICIHEWGRWGPGVQVFMRVVQYRRCEICGKIVERTITQTDRATAELVNDSLQQEVANGEEI